MTGVPIERKWTLESLWRRYWIWSIFQNFQDFLKIWIIGQLRQSDSNAHFRSIGTPVIYSALEKPEKPKFCQAKILVEKWVQENIFVFRYVWVATNFCELCSIILESTTRWNRPLECLFDAIGTGNDFSTGFTRRHLSFPTISPPSPRGIFKIRFSAAFDFATSRVVPEWFLCPFSVYWCSNRLFRTV